MLNKLIAIAICVLGIFSPRLYAADWPMWRADATRSAATTAGLPENLQLLWSRQFPQRIPAWDDPLNRDLMTYDRQLEPIVMDGRLFIGFSDRDQLIAFDTKTGEELWTFYANGPVRLPAAAANGKVWFASDDGFLYCVNAIDGQLHWKFQGAPGNQQVIGNQRLISAWPARGGPVLRDGTVYFTAGIWPMMGTFIYALDAETGRVQWVNDSTGAQYIKQPHSAPSFAGVAPQGALVATKEDLVVPGGRSVPAVFNRSDGKLRYFELNAGGKGTGGSFVAATDEHFYVHTRKQGTRQFALKTGLKTAFQPNEPVLADNNIYTSLSVDGRNLVRAYNSDEKLLWEIPADGSGDLILAGNKLYAGGENTITTIRLPDNNGAAEVVSTTRVKGNVARLLAADEKLFAVTIEGQLLGFGSKLSQVFGEIEDALEEQPPIDKPAEAVVNELLIPAQAQGYACWFGAADTELVTTIAKRSPFVQLAVYDEDANVISRLRQRINNAGLYGKVTAHVATLNEVRLPPYTANMIFIGRDATDVADETFIKRLYESLRPYGGVLQLLVDKNPAEVAAKIESMKLEQAVVTTTRFRVQVQRTGALPGAADWTHQYGDVANTVKSNDKRVKLPLGVLWFGGNSNADVLPRHGHGPPEQVVGGRLFIQGINSLSARDVYTGRVLWKRTFKNLGTFDVYYDATYEDTPLNTKYNQVHIPGANGRGTNYIVADDRVYLLEGHVCHVLDPATGKTLQNIELPADKDGTTHEWGYIGVYENLLLAGRGFAEYQEKLKLDDARPTKRGRTGYGVRSLDRAASQGLIAFDRHSGKLLWEVPARYSFWHNGIVAGGGRIYCLDRHPREIEEALGRRGKSKPTNYRILCLQANTGKTAWQVNENIFGTWLGFSEEYDLLLQSGASAKDRLKTETGRGMTVYNAEDGSVKWTQPDLAYAGPCILHHEWIITNTNSYAESAGAFHLLDGRRKQVPHPLTGELQPWKMTRAYGCNNIIASENLLTFRSGAAGFYDLTSDGGTGNFGGFKSGCTSNLVAANGVLNAPDYTRTCSCAYQNQTSLALVHMPELDYWTIHPSAKSQDESVRHLGLNLGAPGDRRDANGLLWLDVPALSGPAAPVAVQFNDGVNFFQQHSTSVNSDDHPWVLSSGASQVTSVTIDLTAGKARENADGIVINHQDDDAEEQTDGSVNLGSSDLELVRDRGVQLVGLRFNGLALKQGSKVRSAYLQFTCDESTSEPTTLSITAEDTANAARFADSKRNLSSRKTIAGKIAWKPSAWSRVGAAGAAQRSPDVSALVQAVVDREDWRAGQSLVFLIQGKGKRVAGAFRGMGETAARLVIATEETQEEEKVAAPNATENYDVKLYFAGPRQPAEPRRFDVVVQGETVRKDLTIDPSAKSGKPFFIQTIENVAVSDQLKIQLVPRQGSPVLSGVELRRVEGTRRE